MDKLNLSVESLALQKVLTIQTIIWPDMTCHLYAAQNKMLLFS